MRNVLFVLLVFCSLQVPAQTRDNTYAPMVLVSNIKIADYHVPPVSTIDQILAVPKLVPQAPITKVTSYSMVIKKFNGDLLGPFMAKGADMTPEMKNALNSVKASQGTIYVEEIKVLAPDGRNRTLGTITIKYTY